jgi:hypothetical protein
MKKTLLAVMLGLALVGTVDAKPGQGGRSGGGFSSAPGKGSFSTAPAQRSAPAVAPSQKGSFSAPAQTATHTTTTRTTTINRTYSSRYVSPGGYYGHWGMGYGYSNGLLTGMIIGNMMHPYGTTWYTGPGMYGNNAVLYPNGQVVDQNGYLVGTYAGGQFSPIQNGGMVAQQVPADAGAQQQPAQPQVVYVERPGMGVGEVVFYVTMAIIAAAFIILMVGMLG